MLPVHFVVRAFSIEPTEQVDHLGDRTKGLVFGVLVLIDNKLVGTLQCCVTQGRDGTALVYAKDGVDCIENGGMRSVKVGGCNIVTLGGPVDGMIICGI